MLEMHSSLCVWVFGNRDGIMWEENQMKKTFLSDQHRLLHPFPLGLTLTFPHPFLGHRVRAHEGSGGCGVSREVWLRLALIPPSGLINQHLSWATRAPPSFPGSALIHLHCHSLNYPFSQRHPKV